MATFVFPHPAGGPIALTVGSSGDVSISYHLNIDGERQMVRRTFKLADLIERVMDDALQQQRADIIEREMGTPQGCGLSRGGILYCRAAYCVCGNMAWGS